jgi:hypothetical protein
MIWFCSSRIRILVFKPIPDPGVKKAPDPGSATLIITLAFHLNDDQIRDSQESWSFTYDLECFKRTS